LGLSHLYRAQPEIVDFGLGQGRSVFETTGVARATSRIAKKRERRPEPKDAVYRWALRSLLILRINFKENIYLNLARA
jgi:hypothetical protein